MTVSVLEYSQPVDICNRALQHIGATRITALDDDSKNANACAFVYDKVRAAELRRNIWQFSCRRSAMRAAGFNTQLFVPTAYAGATTYAAGALVASNNLYWQSQIAGNVGNTPGQSQGKWEVFFGQLYANPWDSTTAYFPGEIVYGPFLWQASTTYASGNQVTDKNGVVWQSSVNNNLGNIPATGSFWTVVVSPTYTFYLSLLGGNSSNPTVANWLTLTGTSTAFAPLWPIQAGPRTQSFTKNVYPLPYGYLRTAPQEPKAGSQGFLGAPSGLAYNDWELDGNFLVTADVDVILYRFGADFTNVSAMDPMFCEGLAARIAIELCEELTQSGEKLKNAWAAYNTVMKEARLVNGIEEMPTEPYEDEYITVRI